MPVPLTVPGVIDEFIQAKHVWPRSVTDIRHFGLHTPEGPEMPTYARNLGRYFATTDRVASTHFGCDNVLTVRYARDDQTAASARGINTSGIHIEIAGVAAQTAEQWTDEFSTAALKRAAAVFRLYGPGTDTNIPAKILTADELRRGDAGIVKHSTAWAVFGGDFRSDPGAHFPDEMFLAMCRGEQPDEGDDMLTVDLIQRGHNAAGAEAFAIEALQSLGFKPGNTGAHLGRAVTSAKRQWFPGAADVDGVIRGAFWRRMIAEVTGSCPEAIIAQLPPADCAPCEAELAKAQGELASALTKIRAAKDALI